jgi:hypothetical protein
MSKIDAASLFTKTVFDINDQKVDDVQQVFANDKTGDATWVTVNTQGSASREVFIPLDHVTIDGSAIRAPYTLESIVNSPKMVNDKNLSAEEEEELRAYYEGVRGQGATEVTTPAPAADAAAPVAAGSAAPAAHQARDAGVTPATDGTPAVSDDSSPAAVPAVAQDTVSDPSGKDAFDDDHDLPRSRVEDDDVSGAPSAEPASASGEVRGRRAAAPGQVEAEDGYSDATHADHGAAGEPLQPTNTAAAGAAVGGAAVGGAGLGLAATHSAAKDADTVKPADSTSTDSSTPDVKEKAAEVKDAAAEKAAEVKDKAEEAKDAAAEKAADVKDAAAEKAAEVKETAAEHAEAAKAKAADVKEQVAEKAAEVKDAAAEKTAEVKEATAAKVAEVKDQAAAKAAEAKSVAGDKVEAARLKVEQTKEKLAPKVENYKEYGSGFLARLKSFVAQEIEIFKDKK